MGAACLVPDAAIAQEAANDDRVTVSASYITDVIADVDGGLKRGVKWLGRADIVADVPGSRLGIDGGNLHVDVIGIQGGDFSGLYVGDAQVVSNVQAPAALRPYEMWLELPLAGNGLSAKAGLIDLNTEFDLQNVGAGFINSSFGVGPEVSQSGENGPSIFPATSVAGMLKMEWPRTTARLGVFHAVPGNPRSPHSALPNFGLSGGALVILEADREIGGGREVQLGVWSFAGRADALSDTKPDGTPRQFRQRGAYAQAEGRLAKSADMRLDGWVRLGVADSRAQSIGFYSGGGFALTRGDQQAGIAVASARLGNPAVTAGIGAAGKRSETTVELTCSVDVVRWLRVQPDVQYVIHPGWQRNTPDALVVGLRLIFQSPKLAF